MNSTKTAKQGRAFAFTALITVAIFALLLYAIFNPLKFYRLWNNNGKFDTTQDFVKFLDVGQGDCTLIYSNGFSAVIDLGEATTANDVCMDLFDCEIKTIDALLISHLHSDHVGALPKIAELFPIDSLIMPDINEQSIISAQNGKKLAITKGADFYRAKQGINFNIGEFEITMLAAFHDSTNENNRSPFIMAKIGGVKFLFTGDAERKAEKLLLKENLNLDCNVLKVSHHGSNTSTSKDFLKATTPEYAVISVGEDNAYHHPHSQTVDLLKNSKIEVLRTDQSGDITFGILNGEITVTTEK